MKIGDIVYLTEPVEWRKTPDGEWNEYVYPVNTPVKIIGDSGYRGWDIEFIETGVKMCECACVKFSSTPLNNCTKEKLIRVDNSCFDELDTYLSNGWIIKSISACAAIGDCSATKSYCYVHLIKENYENRNTSNSQ